MPVTEGQFSLGQLWPKSNHTWMAPGARNGMDETFGKGLDMGALRVRNGIWEIVIPKSPTHIDPANAEWVPFEPRTFDEKDLHFFYASAFNRYGQGWSYGPGHNLHDEVVGYFMDLNGREPTAMEKLDIEHDRNLWQKLLSDYAIRFPPDPVTDPDKTDPDKTGPDKTGPDKPGPDTTTGLPSLSSPEQRAAELLSLVPATVQQPWMTPVLVELIKAARRKEDRVVQRVLAGLKENK